MPERSMGLVVIQGANRYESYELPLGHMRMAFTRVRSDAARC
jgi:hypothetical protein